MTFPAGQKGSHSPGSGPATGGPAATLVALALLAMMGGLMLSGARGDSATFDEPPHIAAGYTYLTRRSLDFNVEHPPLIKDLAALPLLFMNLDLGWEQAEIAAGKTPDWPTGDPWEFGRKLLDHSSPDPDAVLLAARLPMMAITLLLGWVLFAWTRRRYGPAAALLALTLFVLSPTLLAHGRLVTTDVGAAAGFFIGLIAFLRFLERPTGSNVLLAGAALGFVLLTKFSTFLLVPAFVLLALVWWWLNRGSAAASESRAPWGAPVRWSRGKLLIALPRFTRPAARPGRPDAARSAIPHVTAARVACVLLLGFALVYAVYAQHMKNLPPERQHERMEFFLEGRGVGNTPKDMVRWMVGRPAWRPLGAYFSGIIQNMIRSAQGGGVYLLGTFHPTGVPQYFPLVYLMKEPAALHVLTVLALLSALTGVYLWRTLPAAMRKSWRAMLREDFAAWAIVLVLAVYWLMSIRSHLNLGVRHILPVLPLTFVLVARELRSLAVRLPLAMNFREGFVVHTGLVLTGYFAFVGALLAWQAASVLRAQPHHMSYFNELAGGPENGWQRLTDSNADWGQDMGRLAKFVEERRIEKLALDYFGSSDANRYLAGKWEPINLCSEPRKGWVAVSTMFYQNSAANPACDYRRWLPIEKLAAKVGYSTLVFHVE